MPQYVLLQHDWNEIHFDFMLELEGKLLTWRLPLRIKQGQQLAIRITDHRLAYLHYEGVVSGNRGSVIRIARGNYLIHKQTVDTWLVELSGDYQGCLKMVRQQEDVWLFEFQAKELSGPAD